MQAISYRSSLETPGRAASLISRKECLWWRRDSIIMPVLCKNAARSSRCKARSSSSCSGRVASKSSVERRITWRACGQSSTSRPPLKRSSSAVGCGCCCQSSSSSENSFFISSPPLSIYPVIHFLRERKQIHNIVSRTHDDGGKGNLLLWNYTTFASYSAIQH